MEWQEESVRLMLLYAATKVPYYRKCWEGKDLKLAESIANWPVLEKDVVRHNPEQFISDDYDIQQLTKMHTSGTSGKPMTIYLDAYSIGLWYALYDRRIKEQNGVDPVNDAYGTFAGQLVCDKNQLHPPYWVRNAFGNQVYFSSYHLSSRTINDYVRALHQYKLKYLMGYTSSLHNIAVLAKAKGIELPLLKLVITNSEPLYEHQRKQISEAFKCPVIQTYSGCEYAFGGSEDLSRTMWLWPESGLLEVLNAEGFLIRTGKGELVATGLVNKAMPLIRYRIGDSGTIGSTECMSLEGQMLQLTTIEGRTDDLIRTPDGTLVGRLDPVFKADFLIREAQIIQEKIDFIRLKVVEENGFDESQKQELIERLKSRVGGGIQIVYEAVQSIPRGPNGKFKAVVSLVNK